ncbi:hypothetical protein ES703_65943 [subsurface metagenome]
MLVTGNLLDSYIFGGLKDDEIVNQVNVSLMVKESIHCPIDVEVVFLPRFQFHKLALGFIEIRWQPLIVLPLEEIT